MRAKVVVGACFWLSIACLGGWFATSADLDQRWQKLYRYATKSPERLKVEVPKSEAMIVGEQVLCVEGPRWELVGRVEATAVEGEQQVVSLVMDPEAPRIRSLDQFHVIDARGDINWALKLILPREKMERIATELNQFREQNEKEIIELTQIAGQHFVNESITIIDQNLAGVLKRHEAEWKAVLDKHRVSLKTKLIPVVKQELGPTVKKSLQPLLTKIGRELWDELPLWTVTWRSVADQIPYVRQQYMEKWWNEFLENKAIPIVSAHEQEIIKLGEKLVFKGAENPKVRAKMAEVARELVNDPAFRKLSSAILNETIVKPFDSEAFFRELFANPRFRTKFNMLTARFGPVAERIAKMLVENEKGPGVSPELIEVVRRLFFEKNRRALLLIRSEKGEALKVDQRIKAQIAGGRGGVWQAPVAQDNITKKQEPVPEKHSVARRGVKKTAPNSKLDSKQVDSKPVDSRQTDNTKPQDKGIATQTGDF